MACGKISATARMKRISMENENNNLSEAASLQFQAVKQIDGLMGIHTIILLTRVQQRKNGWARHRRCRLICSAFCHAIDGLAANQTIKKIQISNQMPSTTKIISLAHVNAAQRSVQFNNLLRISCSFSQLKMIAANLTQDAKLARKCKLHIIYYYFFPLRLLLLPSPPPLYLIKKKKKTSMWVFVATENWNTHARARTCFIGIALAHYSRLYLPVLRVCALSCDECHQLWIALSLVFFFLFSNRSKSTISIRRHDMVN